MIIFINGSINSGKSTVAKLLSQKLPNSAVVEIDKFHEFIEWMPIQEAVSLNLENALSVITNFRKRELTVIVPYPLSQKNYDYLRENLEEGGEKVKVFTLNPQLEKVLENRGARELTEEERERIKYHYEIGINTPKFGTIIDNSEQSPEETVEVIVQNL